MPNFCSSKAAPSLLHLAHHTPLAGSPRITRQFYTMRAKWYWPSMIADIRAVSKSCHACATGIKDEVTKSPFEAVQTLGTVGICCY